MRYLITGGAGFIGSHLAQHLVGAGHEVVVLDDLSTGRRENLVPVADRVHLIVGSVTDPDTCRRALDGVDCVLHQAAVTSVERDRKSTRLNSSHGSISYAVFCLKKKN